MMISNMTKVIRIYHDDDTILYTVTPYNEEVRLLQILSEAKFLRRSVEHHKINKIIEDGGAIYAEVIGECKERSEVKMIISQHKNKSKPPPKRAAKKRTTKKSK